MPNSTGTSDGSSAESIVAQDGNNVSRRLTKSDNNLATEASKSNIAALTITLASDGRETWDKKIEFLLSVIGFAVDLGNVWRFPYICYQNGGGAFLIPWCVMLIFGGLPLFYMELALGQYYRSGCISIWKHICPAVKGVGYAICIIDLYVGIHYNTIIGWAVYYLVESFQQKLPWTSCGNDWNTLNCTETNDIGDLEDTSNTTSPAKEYFERKVLESHESNMDNMGEMRWPLVLCVFSVFIIVYFSLWKGVRSSGKAVWVTALAPYVVLFILLIKGVTLPGASKGIEYYLTPQWEKLITLKVWIDAATQIFFSLGPGFGTLLALSSYNKFHNNCYRDAIITSTINCLTSFLAGFVIFSCLGFMAQKQNTTIDKVGLEGPGLVFIVYPEAIATMYAPNFWSIIFFLMLITLGLDSTFGGLEAIITALCDEYPVTLGRHREIFVGVLILFVFVCTLPTCTQGGTYLVTLLTTYGPGLSILFVVFVEATAVCWIYGVERFSCDVEKMIGKKPSWFWRTCWNFITPIFILAIFLFSLYAYEDLEEAGYVYPKWSIAIGWVLTMSSLIWIPVYMIYLYLITPGSPRERIRKMIKPIDPAEMMVYTPSTNYGFNRPRRQKSSSVQPENHNLNSSPVKVTVNQSEHSILDRRRSSSSSTQEKVDKSLLAPESSAMVDIRSSLTTSTRLIGSPPPSILKERSKKRERQAQSKLALEAGLESGIQINVEQEEETVIPSGEESFPAIMLSKCPDVDSQMIRQNGAIVDSKQANTPSNSRDGRRSSLTPPPRLISFIATDGSTPAAQEWTAKDELQ